jgi:hypothetical protein
MFYVKIHRHKGELLVAACDKNLLGKTLADGELELEVKESFYGGELKDAEELVSLIREATMANLVGNNAVDEVIKKGYVNPENTITIGGVKHAQYALMED